MSHWSQRAEIRPTVFWALDVESGGFVSSGPFGTRAEASAKYAKAIEAGRVVIVERFVVTAEDARVAMESER